MCGYVRKKYAFTSVSVVFFLRHLFELPSFNVNSGKLHIILYAEIMVHLAMVTPTREGEQAIIFVKTFLIFDNLYETE